jgi:hypothetical protein
MKSSFVMNDDVLKLILTYLPLSDKLKLQIVCSQFEYCVNDLLKSQRGLTIGNFLNHCNDARHSTINGDLSQLLKEQIFYIRENKEKLSPLFSKCPNLKCLELANCHLDPQTIEWLKEFFPKLECFRIESNITSTGNNSWTRIANCLSDSLTHLYIYGYYLDKNAIIELSLNLPQLQELSVKHYKHNFGLLFQSLGPKINRLSLIYCNHLNENDIQLLVDKDIKYFSVQNCNNSTEVFNEICRKMINLKTLVIRSHSLESSLGRLRYLTKLESLNLLFYQNTFLNFSLFGANQLINLKNLTLDACKNSFINYFLLSFFISNSKRLINCRIFKKTKKHLKIN